MQKNQQPAEPRFVSDGKTLSVHSIFYTIQGEGPHAGSPAVFLRLAGCNLQCPLCDTEYTDGVGTMRVDDIVMEVDRISKHATLVVLTGGEPLRQNVSLLCAHLSNAGFLVQIETNGKLPPQNPDIFYALVKAGDLDVVLSPKTARVDKKLGVRATAWKFVLQAGDIAPDGLPVHALGHPLPQGSTIARPDKHYEGDVFVQPADEQDTMRNAANMQAAVEAVMYDDSPNTRRLCLQMHKYANLD